MKRALLATTFFGALMLASVRGDAPATASVPAATGVSDVTAQARRLETAAELVKAQRSEEAIRTQIEPVIQYFEQKYAEEKRAVYCSRSETETLGSLLHAARENQNALAIGPEWAKAYFIKAYALVELGRPAEAERCLEQALRRSPFNAQYLNELGHLRQIRRDWTGSQECFKRAEEYAQAYTPEELKLAERTRALRGQGYNLIELGRLDEAEQRFRDCLNLDANDRGAEAELNFVVGLKARRSSPQQPGRGAVAR